MTFIGARIKQAREAAKLSQAELGARVGKSGSQVSSWESGRSVIDAEDLHKVAQALEKPFGYFGQDRAPRHLLDQFDVVDLLSYINQKLRNERSRGVILDGQDARQHHTPLVDRPRRLARPHDRGLLDPQTDFSCNNVPARERQLASAPA